MIYLVDIIVFLFLVLVIVNLFNLIGLLSTFRRDERNPYRRFCKTCGQQQDYHTMTMEDRYGWWEDMGMIHNESCVCHKFSEYH